MVKHRRRDGTEYWQLPGGALEVGETPQEAVIRELWEETGLVGKVIRYLFTIPYKYGASTTFLVEVVGDRKVNLGTDPEEVAADHRQLVEVGWHSLNDVAPNIEIRHLLLTL